MRYVAVIGGLSALALYVLVRLAFGLPVSRSLGWLAFGWAEWIVLAPLVVRLATAVPYRRRQRWRFIGVHLAGALAFHGVHFAVYVLVFVSVRGLPPSPGPSLLTIILGWIPVHMWMDVLIYGVTWSPHRCLSTCGRRHGGNRNGSRWNGRWRRRPSTA